MPCSSRWAQRPGNLCRLQGLTQLWLDQNSIGDAGARRPGVADVVLEQKSSARPPRPELLHRCCSPAIGLERQLRGLQMPCSSRWAQRPGNLCRLQGLTQLWARSKQHRRRRCSPPRRRRCCPGAKVFSPATEARAPAPMLFSCHWS